MGDILEVPLEEELKESYLDYAMSVIVGRALPDVRDGLKPVQRRILYAMFEAGNDWNKPYKKSARIVGEVIGKYHPHGDTPVYEALVRLAQEFTMRYPLVDGQGNFGSVDGDPPAAMRYTEVRLTRIAQEMLADLEKETVEFTANYDNSLQEPVVLPSKLPNLLVNGTTGIAVGMATSIPPHNLGEVVLALIALLRTPDLTVADLTNYIKGPDFPTGAYLVGRQNILTAYETGRGSIKLRAKYQVEKEKNRVKIVFTEIPYQVNKAGIVERIAKLIKERKLEGASEVRDESDRQGIRIVVELKREWSEAPHSVAKEILRNTPLETNFGLNFLALVNGRPEVLNLKEVLQHFLNWRKTVVLRRTQYDLRKAREKAHVLEGFLKALENLDEIIELIKGSDTPKIAKERLITRFYFTEVQAQEILNLKLQRLTALERENILLEYEELKRAIQRFEKILTHEPTLLATIEEELKKLREDFADDRKTQIIEEEDFIEEKKPEIPMILVVSEEGFVRKLSVEEFSPQKRGGKGALAVYGEERISQVVLATAEEPVLVFTEEGRVYPLSLKDIPPSGKQAKGNHLRTYIPSFDGLTVSLLPSRESHYLVMVTKKGQVKKVPVDEFEALKKTGGTAIFLKDEDKLRGVLSLKADGQILIATQKGLSLHFPTKELRPMGRRTEGVIGIRLQEGDEVVGMVEATNEGYLLTITEGGFGKKTKLSEFRLQKRGGMGLTCHKLTQKTGPLASLIFLTEEVDVIVFSSSGRAIRINTQEIPISARSTQGARIISLLPGERVVRVIKVLGRQG